MLLAVQCEHMQARTLIIDTLKNVENSVTIAGWVKTRRDHGKIVFFDVYDRTSVIQVVLAPDIAEGVGIFDAVTITGKVVKRPEKLINPELPTGTVEMQAEALEVLAKSKELPFDMGTTDLNLQLPTLLDNRSLTLRHPKITAIFTIQAAMANGFRRAAKQIGCTEIFVPTISASATEGGAEVFKVDYYGHPAYMTQSPQLYKQMLVPVFERVFTIAHAYRAEPSVTTRHLSEVTMLDCEIGFVSFTELLDLMETVGTEMLKFVEEQCENELALFNVPNIAFGTIPRLTLQEAQEVIFKEFGRDSRGEKDLNPQDEIEICKWALEKHKTDFVTITHFPTKKRAFYTMPDPNQPELSLSYDLLFRGVEILSGSQRINDYDQLVNAIKDRGMDPENFAMYLQTFKYGMPPEGGFSFGLERMTKNVLQLDNIREASLYPRDMERVDVRLSTINQD